MLVFAFTFTNLNTTSCYTYCCKCINVLGEVHEVIFVVMAIFHGYNSSLF